MYGGANLMRRHAPRGGAERGRRAERRGAAAARARAPVLAAVRQVRAALGPLASSPPPCSTIGGHVAATPTLL